MIYDKGQYINLDIILIENIIFGLINAKYIKLSTAILKNCTSIFDVPSLLHKLLLMLMGVGNILQFYILNFSSIYDICRTMVTGTATTRIKSYA